MAKLFANSGDPDQMLCSAASDLGLHCLPITLPRISRLQWINKKCLKKALLMGPYNIVSWRNKLSAYNSYLEKCLTFTTILSDLKHDKLSTFFPEN